MLQTPRVDLNAPTNQIEHHSAVKWTGQTETVSLEEQHVRRQAEMRALEASRAAQRPPAVANPLTAQESVALLQLFAHARACPGQHESAEHAEVCRSAKFLMLHVRDWPVFVWTRLGPRVSGKALAHSRKLLRGTVLARTAHSVRALVQRR